MRQLSYAWWKKNRFKRKYDIKPLDRCHMTRMILVNDKRLHPSQIGYVECSLYAAVQRHRDGDKWYYLGIAVHGQGDTLPDMCYEVMVKGKKDFRSALVEMNDLYYSIPEGIELNK